SFGNAGIIGNSYFLPFRFPPLNKILNILFDQDTAARIHYSSIPAYLPWLLRFYLRSQEKGQLETSRAIWPLVSPALNEHMELMKGTDVEKHLHKTGRVALYRREESFLADAFDRKVADTLNVPYEIFSCDDFRDIEPDLNPVFKKAVRWPTSPRVDNPGYMVDAYAKTFVDQGGTFLKIDVRKLVPKDAFWRLETLGSTVEAKEIVVCTGPWANEIVRALGYHFPMALKRGYHQHFHAEGNRKLSHALFDADGGFGLVPMESGYRLCTGAEFAEMDAPPTPLQITRALPAAKALFPLGPAIEPMPWCGNRPCFTDSLPVIGPAPKHKGLWFNFGHGHVGLTIGPASGRLAAEMLDGSDTFCDPAPYRADRFSC
ncbi:MAG: FAD-binding oxidoreductase, partial [Alphaproteobacteria bacterium]